MQEIYISDAVKYVGVNDKDLDLFESQYVIPHGVSYNAYVIMDRDITVLDTVDARKTDEWLEKLLAVLDGKTPAYLVISHMEPDHAANILELAKKFPEMKLVSNKKTFGMLLQFFDTDFSDRQVEVGEGDTLNTGSHTLQFFMAPMVHWPEVMVTYEQSEKILFSADAFGKFGTLDTEEEWADEARRYYFNIVGKYGMQAQALLKKAAALDIQTICPLHGPILKENLGYYIGKYLTWSSYVPEDEGVLVAYASIHGNTAVAAKKFAAILEEKGAKNVIAMDLSREDMAKAVENAFRYDKLVLACATYDGGMFPCMEEFLNHLKAKNFQKRKAALIENGSWGPAAARLMKQSLEGMKQIEICTQTVTIKSVMKAADIGKMRTLADELLG